MILNKQFVTYAFLSLVFIVLIGYWSNLYIDTHRSTNAKSDDTSQTKIADGDTVYQMSIVSDLFKRKDIEGQLLYDMEISGYDDTFNAQYKVKLLDKYKNLFDYSNKKNASSTIAEQTYKRDLAVYGWIYIYSNLMRVVPDNVTSIKEIRKWHKDDIDQVLKIAYIPTSPEIINDKIFLATRLKISSEYIINFKNMITKEEANKYKKYIKSDLDAMDRTNMSMFTSSNSKLILAPALYKMLALVALHDASVQGIDTAIRIENQYKIYKDLKTKDLYSYAWTGVYMDAYYLYHLEHPAFETASTTAEYLQKINNAKASMSERLKYSEAIKFNFNTMSKYLKTDKGRWEIAKSAMTDI